MEGIDIIENYAFILWKQKYNYILIKRVLYFEKKIS